MVGERDGEGSATPDTDRERVQMRAALDRLALNQRDAFCALVLRTFFSPSPLLACGALALSHHGDILPRTAAHGALQLNRHVPVAT